MKEQTLRICSYDVLPNGTVKPSALQRYFQQIALDDIAAGGATYPALRALSMVFVLTRLRLDIVADIRSGDSVLLRTYPYKVEGVTFFRAFEIWRDGEMVALADSRWVLLNYERRSIMRPSDLPFPIPEQTPTIDFPAIPRRIRLERDAEKTVSRTVLLTELDENRHLNNCTYSDYCLDHAPVNVEKARIRSMCILFDHEAYLGNTLELCYQTDDDGFSVIAQDTSIGKNCFQAKFALDFSI